MKRTAIQFGAGNIGRGFLAQLFHESGLEIVFVDVSDPVIEALNTRRGYEIEIVGPGACRVPITAVRAVHGRNLLAVADEIAQAEIVCTAVGANALPHVAPALAEGLLLRRRRSARPLNALLCENLHDASAVLRSYIGTLLPADEAASVWANTGFVQAVVSRMVPLQTEADRRADILAVKVEAYKRLPVDANGVVGELPQITGIEPVPNFEAYVERKLYTHNCAHAVLGYLGYQAHHTYGYEALRDPAVRARLDTVLTETGDALVRKHGFPLEQQRTHEADLLARFQNQDLGDTCIRLARDPIRKLASDDRLVGAARLCEAQGIVSEALPLVIAAALRYDGPDDSSASELQRMVCEQGFDVTLRRVCGIQPDEPLAARIRTAWERT